MATTNPDALATKLVVFIRLLQRGQARAAELDQFMSENATWPNQSALKKRLEEALATETDGAVVRRICDARKIEAVSALLHCADVAGPIHARRAWVQGITDIADQTAFLQRWADALTPEDDWQRFDRLAWTDDKAASAEIARLDGDHAAAAQARLALRHDDKQALPLLARVSASLRADPSLMLEQARFLRRSDALIEAVALWRTSGNAAEAAAPATRRAAFWNERDALARKLLTAGNAADARDMAADDAVAPDQQPDALFLTGWIALRRLNDPAAAKRKFQDLAQSSHAAISQGRAWYWLARTAESTGDLAATQTAYARSAAFPTTFYGQLAALNLHSVPAIDQDPSWTSQQETDFAGAEPSRAAKILCSWGDQARAGGFLLSEAQARADPSTFAQTAQLAIDLELTETAVQIARLAGRQGVMLPQSGWPVAFQPAGAHAPLVLGIMRQESSFNASAISPAGAVGLMQLRPATASEAAHRATDTDALRDPLINMRIGTAYIDRLLTDFDNVVPYALAAYNAGPHRVRLWQATASVPTDEAGMIDWIELIPYPETRNYVQRVIEGATIYAVKRGARFDAFGKP